MHLSQNRTWDQHLNQNVNDHTVHQQYHVVTTLLERRGLNQRWNSSLGSSLCADHNTQPAVRIPTDSGKGRREPGRLKRLWKKRWEVLGEAHQLEQNVQMFGPVSGRISHCKFIEILGFQAEGSWPPPPPHFWSDRWWARNVPKTKNLQKMGCKSPTDARINAFESSRRARSDAG